mmetsp:Transcript_35167/g.73651  ORF Transcript_35167/g.73651 Transcript_35167/m.73651 type:complete len:96 (+) Transcript_35167:282-569(+)
MWLAMAGRAAPCSGGGGGGGEKALKSGRSKNDNVAPTLKTFSKSMCGSGGCGAAAAQSGVALFGFTSPPSLQALSLGAQGTAVKSVLSLAMMPSI